MVPHRSGQLGGIGFMIHSITASATLHAGYLLRRNMRVVGEFTQQFRGPDYGKVNVGIITAF